jgi:DNA-binding protein HU-beta
MTKNELVSLIAQKSDLKKNQAEAALAAFIESVGEVLAKGDDVVLVGFGTFSVRDRQAREGHNPKTGEKVQIPACKVPGFRAGKNLRDAVNS